MNEPPMNLSFLGQDEKLGTKIFIAVGYCKDMPNQLLEIMLDAPHSEIHRVALRLQELGFISGFSI